MLDDEELSEDRKCHRRLLGPDLRKAVHSRRALPHPRERRGRVSLCWCQYQTGCVNILGDHIWPISSTFARFFSVEAEAEETSVPNIWVSILDLKVTSSIMSPIFEHVLEHSSSWIHALETYLRVDRHFKSPSKSPSKSISKISEMACFKVTPTILAAPAPFPWATFSSLR